MLSTKARRGRRTEGQSTLVVAMEEGPPEKAYNGTNSKKYYQTPSAFFSGRAVNTDAADTSQGAVGVLDRKGVVRVTQASGTRVFLPFIPGVGICRLRYPIMPVHGEGSAVWKELEATKDVLMKSKTYGYLYREPLGGGSGVVPTEPPQKPLTLRMGDATKTPPGAHVHEITLTPAEVEMAKKGTIILGMLTSTGAGHQHTIDIQWIKNKWRIARCDMYDSGPKKCRDQHGKFLHEVNNV